jgi:hypothetical protein
MEELERTLDEDGLPRGMGSESGWRFERRRSILGFDRLSIESLAQERSYWSEGKWRGRRRPDDEAREMQAKGDGVLEVRDRSGSGRCIDRRVVLVLTKARDAKVCLGGVWSV